MVPVMEQTFRFCEILEAVDSLSLDEQQVLLDIISHRMIELSRKRMALEIQESRKEFVEGLCRRATTKQIMDEIES
jgi:hypothetical protein